MGILRQPLRLRDEHFIDHLPDLLGRVGRADERIVQHGELQHLDVARDRRLHRHALYIDQGKARGRAGIGERETRRHVEVLVIDLVMTPRFLTLKWPG